VANWFRLSIVLRKMAEQNWQARDIWSVGPKFRIDVNNPQVGGSASDVYNMYGVSNQKDVTLIGMSESGLLRIYSDKTVEIKAGNKNEKGDLDLVITTMNGDMCLTAQRNGAIRIKGKNIVIEATEDVDIKAGRNINLASGSGRILMTGTKIDKDRALVGSFLDAADTFGGKVFSGTFVGGGAISGAFTLGKALIRGI